MPVDMVIDEADLPGAGFNFQDVTHIFTEAANDMEPGEFIFMEDFTLYEAMSAFEIGEPRLDSGIVPLNQNGRKFNPQAPLLPEELCWIIDRCFAYEVSKYQPSFVDYRQKLLVDEVVCRKSSFSHSIHSSLHASIG